MKVRLAEVRAEALSIDEVYAAVADAGAGGVCLFVGTVRDHDEGQDVIALDYTAHPTATERLRAVADRIALDPEVVAVATVHRTGELAIGDIAVICAVSAAHRPEAFAACRRLIDDLKDEVPIWKHQSYPDGTATWTGSP